jgi:RNA polymerase sigma-70 factor (ECF subfamily)
MSEGLEQGLHLIDSLLARKNGELANYHLAHSARADLCRRLGRIPEARASYEKALALVVTGKDPRESARRFLARRLEELK